MFRSWFCRWRRRRRLSYGGRFFDFGILNFASFRFGILAGWRWNGGFAPGWGVVGTRAGHAKDAIGSIGNGAGFICRYVPGYFGFGGFGFFLFPKVVVFFETESFAVQTSESVEKSDEIEGIRFQLALLQDAKDFRKSNLNQRFLESWTVIEFGHFGT